MGGRDAAFVLENMLSAPSGGEIPLLESGGQQQRDRATSWEAAQQHAELEEE